jgi:hypothetical protein
MSQRRQRSERLFDMTGSKPDDPAPLRRDRQGDHADGARKRPREHHNIQHRHHGPHPSMFANVPTSKPADSDKVPANIVKSRDYCDELHRNTDQQRQVPSTILLCSFFVLTSSIVR